MQEYVEFIRNNMMLCLGWAGVFVALVMNLVKSKTAAYKELTAAQVTQIINKEDGVVVDIRTKDEFKQGHITDSVHVLAADIKAGTTPTLEKYKANPIIVVCKTGSTAHENANLLAKAGFEQVYLLKGGIIAWSEAKMPLLRGKK